MLARFAELFVARRSEPIDIVVSTCVLLFAPALALWLFGQIARRISIGLGRNVHIAMCGLLVSVAAVPITNRWLAASDAAFSSPIASLTVAAAIGIAWGAIYARSEIISRLVTVLAGAPLVFAGVFAMQAPIRALLFDGGAEAGDSIAPSIAPRTPAPITLVVFDELPLASLLDESGAIDAVTYPNFARLAATSTWFRNATTVESRTLQAIPAILSGRYPTADRRLPIASQHPNTLFSLLANHYTLNVYESLTNLHGVERGPQVPFTERMAGLSRDVALIYAHTLMPLAWSRELPPIDDGWRDFDEGRAVPRSPKRGLRGRPTLFRHFVRSIGTAQPPSLNFIHSVLPHGPWQYMPSGDSFHPFNNFGRFLGYWSETEHFAAEAQWRHLLQVELVDSLLGMLLDHLDAIGAFERSIVVVVADHGASFWSKDHYRDFESGDHPADILSVPLFIKRPHQSAGSIDHSNAETIDILPSILDLIGAELPTAVDGCSLFEPSCPPRPQKIAFSDAGGESLIRHDFPLNLGDDDAGLRQRIARFGSGADRSAYRASPYFDWIGRTIGDFELDARQVGTVSIESPHRTWQLDPSEKVLPARIVGELQLSREIGEPLHVAIATAGVIRAVVPAPLDGDVYRIVTVLPEAAIATDDTVDLYVVTGSNSLGRLVAR